MLKYLNLLIILLIVSCNNSTNKDNKSINQLVIKNKTNLKIEDLTRVERKDTLRYTYQIFKSTSPYLIENEDGIDTTYFQISYPFFEDKDINYLINDYIVLESEKTVDQVADSFLSGFNEFVEDQSTSTVNFPWHQLIISKVITNTPLLLTISTFRDEYTGGAHGNHVTLLSNFDLTANKKVELKEIIKKDKLTELTSIAETYFRKIENISDTTSLKDYFFLDGNFSINDNFAITKDGLLFFYNEYEIKPYSEGTTEILIPFSDITDQLNNKGKKYVQSVVKPII